MNLENIKSKYLIFDTETTGLPTRATYDTYHHPKKLQCYDSARLVQIAYIILDEDRTPIKLYDAIVKPKNFVISPEIAKIHGITQEIAEQKGTDIKYVLPNILYALKNVDTIVAHNIGFDYSIIMSEAYRIGFTELIEELQKKRCFCTKVQGQKQLKPQKAPKLTELHSMLITEENWIQKHEALDDTFSCMRCFVKLYDTKEDDRPKFIE